MKKVLSISPGRQDFALMLGQLYGRKGDYKMARGFFEQVAKSNGEEAMRRQAEEMLKRLTDFEEQTARFEAMKKAGPVQFEASTVITDPGTQEPADPSATLRGALRKPAAGEMQLQAKLVKIECEPKAIVFVVQTATGLLRLKTATFDDIQITTFDPKVNGEITCPWKDPATVVVCYVPGVNKRARVDGVLKSVEFVPADFNLKP